MLWLLTSVVAGLLGGAAGGDILAVLPVPVYSHTVPFLPALEHLADRGHRVTLISPFKSQHPSIINLHLNYTIQNFRDDLLKVGVDMFNARSMTGIWYEVTLNFDACHEMSSFMSRIVRPHLPDPASSSVSLLLTELFFCQEIFAALGHIYKAPVVSKHPGPVVPILAYPLGNPTPTAYIPHIRLVHSDQMSFLQRAWNFLITIFDEIAYNTVILPKVDKKMREAFGDYPDLPYIGDLVKNTSLVMTETHFALNYPRPFARNIIEIGGMGAKMVEPLSQELEKFINESDAGVIYMSWGSHFQSDDMNETLAAMMDGFSRLKQRVLFKWYVDIPNKPSNVLIKKWFPQNSILSHEKVLLYISHCGVNSIYEAGYHGIPVIATPLFVDQPHNALILERFGMAEIVNPESIKDGHTFINAIKKVLSQPSYRENAKRRSAMLRDRPLPVLSEIAFWMEYVMKHGGEHMRPTGALLPWYTRCQLDVLALFSFVLALILLLFSKVIALCFRARKPPSSKRKKE